MIIVQIVLLICCNNPENSIPQEGVLIPLSEGNHWDYRKTSSRLEVLSPEADTVNMKVVQSDTMDGFAGYYVENLIIGPVIFGPADLILANRSDGLYSALRSLDFYPPPAPTVERALAYPTDVDERIEYSSYQIVTKSLSEPISVPAGDYDCLWYEVYGDTTLLGEIWVKPDIGIIRSWIQFGIKKYYHDLIEYEIPI